MHCSSGGPKFSAKHPHQVSQPPVTSAPENPMPLLVCRHCTPAHPPTLTHIHIHNKINLSVGGGRRKLRGNLRKAQRLHVCCVHARTCSETLSQTLAIMANSDPSQLFATELQTSRQPNQVSCMHSPGSNPASATQELGNKRKFHSIPWPWCPRL